MHRGRTVRAATIILVLLGALALAQPAAAQSGARGARANRYDVVLTAQQGGAVAVQETQQIEFTGGPFQHGYRRIPLDRVEAIRDVRVEEPNQPYKSGREAPNTFAVSGPSSGGTGSLLVDWWFSPTSNATRTFVISYVADGAVRFYDAGDQLRWQVFGADRPYQVLRGAVSLTLPAPATSGWQVAAYPDRYLPRNGATASGATAAWTLTDVPANQALEVRAQWPHGIVTGSAPGWQQAADAADFRRENLRPVLDVGLGALSLLVLVAGSLGIFLTWYTRGRDPAIGAVAGEITEPPSDLAPGVAGTVMDEVADVGDAVATVLDLARREVISIQELHDERLGGSQRDFEITLLQPDAMQSPALAEHERQVLRTFFVRGSPVRLTQLGTWFHSSIPLIQQALHHEAARAGYFVEDPEAIRRRYRRWGTWLAIGGVVLAFVACSAAADYSGAAPWPFISLALVGGALRLFSGRMPRRTAAGALEAARWRAYRRYLQHAPPEALQHGDLDRLTVYAVALGIQRGWVDKLANLGVPAPRWIQPPVIVMGGPTWGGPMWGGWPGGGRPGGGPGGGPDGHGRQGGPGGGPQGASDAGAGGLERANGSLTDLLNAASEVLSRGGGSDWSGGGFGGGGGGSGGGGGGFD